MKFKVTDFKEININAYEGFIPEGSELVIAEKGNVFDTAIVLYGFDEVGLYDGNFTNPVYGFISEDSFEKVLVV